MAVRREVHLGDAPVRYELEIFDGDVPYDPTTADDVKLLFACPDGVTYERTASVEVASPGWLVIYETTVYDAENLHGTAGRYSMQAWFKWDDGRQFHSTIERVDDEDAELRIHKNLDAD